MRGRAGRTHHYPLRIGRTVISWIDKTHEPQFDVHLIAIAKRSIATAAHQTNTVAIDGRFVQVGPAGKQQIQLPRRLFQRPVDLQ